MMLTGNTPGNDLRFQWERLEGARNFTNKIWNASRFVVMNLTGFKPEAGEPVLSLADQWILSTYNNTAGKVTTLLEEYDPGEAARTLYEFIWNIFCDWYIEVVKPCLYKGNQSERHTAQHVLHYVLEGTLRLLHPFMPFITEEIWQSISHTGDSIMLSPWPQWREEFDFPEAEREMQLTMEVIRGIRNIRGEMKVSPGQRVEVLLVAQGQTERDTLAKGRSYIELLGSAAPLKICPALPDGLEKAATAIVGGVVIIVPLAGLIDLGKEIERLQKEYQVINRDLEQVNRKLTSQGFLAKAPGEVVAKEQAKKAEFEAKIEAVDQRLKTLTG